MRNDKTNCKGLWIEQFIRELEDCNPTAMMILAIIRNFQKNSIKCFISDAYLANVLHVSKATVSRIIKKLNEAGYIKIEKVGRKRYLYIIDN